MEKGKLNMFLFSLELHCSDIRFIVGGAKKWNNVEKGVFLFFGKSRNSLYFDFFFYFFPECKD